LDFFFYGEIQNVFAAEPADFRMILGEHDHDGPSGEQVFWLPAPTLVPIAPLAGGPAKNVTGFNLAIYLGPPNDSPPSSDADGVCEYEVLVQQADTGWVFVHEDY
jgi:hypothetical protein